MAIELLYLSGRDIEALALSDEEILSAVEGGLIAQGRGEAVLEPRAHLVPDPTVRGHFNVLRGAILPLGLAGVKVVGDYLDNYRRGLPSEFALLLLLDVSTGTPVAVLDATAITEMRTGALTALGARYLARRDSRVLGHIGARGTAYWNIRLTSRLFPLEEIRVHSRRSESQTAFAVRLRDELGLPVRTVDDWKGCVEGADIVVEASRLDAPQPLLKTAWIKPGALVIPYGTMSAVELDLIDIMNKVVVDDWAQCLVGPLGSLRSHVDSGRLTRDRVHAELADVVVGRRTGRERSSETILFWHRGLATSDIALGQAIVAKGRAQNVGRMLPYQ